MANRLGLERVLGWLWQRPPTEVIDPADVGTAFGMELSFYPSGEGDQNLDGSDADLFSGAPPRNPLR